jgi:hypothetical protein
MEKLMKSRVYRNIKKNTTRRITFHGKYIIQWYDGENWRNYLINKL